MNMTNGMRRYRFLAHLAAVVESSDDAIFSQTLDGVIMSWNRAAERLYGYAAKEAIGRSVTMLVPSDSAEEISEILARLRRGEGLVQYGTVWQRRDGTRVDVSLTISPITDASGIVAAATIGRDITERKRIEETLRRLNTELEYKAYHDALTGLPNRVLFADRLRQALARARRYRTRVAVLLIDINRFKRINDTFGHDVGDTVLVEVARRIQGCLRESDTVARWGGDEFSVILTNVRRPEDAAARVTAAVRQSIVVDGRRELHVTLSVGVSLFPVDGVAPDELVRCADNAMYRTKHELRRSTLARFGATSDVNFDSTSPMGRRTPPRH
jgi:diguanylate cyclase (GGDEF)-like protein/PAS domain S-box-containing protein